MSQRSTISGLTDALESGERFPLTSSQVLKILPFTDDTGSLQFGDGTYDMDVTVFLGDTSTYVKFDKGAAQMTVRGVAINTNSTLAGVSTLSATTVNATTGNITTVNATNVVATNTNTSAVNMTGILTPSGSGYVEQKVVTVNSNTTINATHYGSVFVSNGGGALVHTIPDPSADNAGAWFDVINVVNQDVTFTCTGKIIWLNDATADSVIANTSSEKIGASGRFVSASTKWCFFPFVGTWTPAT